MCVADLQMFTTGKLHSGIIHQFLSKVETRTSLLSITVTLISVFVGVFYLPGPTLWAMLVILKPIRKWHFLAFLFPKKSKKRDVITVEFRPTRTS